MSDTIDEAQPETLDVKSQAFLSAVYEAGGEASTTEIRDRTGLDNGERTYRFGKLENLNLISVSEKSGPYSGAHRPKVASLTDDGESLVERGISEEAQEWLVESETTARLDDLEERVELLERQNRKQHERLSSLESWRETISALLTGEDSD